MSHALLALIISLGVGGWIFMKMQQQSGYGNGGRSFKAAAAATLIIFIIAFTITQMILH